MYACHLQHASEAELLLDRSIALDAESEGRSMAPGTFCIYPVLHREQADVHGADPSRPGNLSSTTDLGRAARGRPDVVVDGLRREAWLLSDEQVEFQVSLIGAGVLSDRGLSSPLF